MHHMYMAQSGGAGDPQQPPVRATLPDPCRQRGAALVAVLGEAPEGSLAQPHPHGNAACHQASAFEGVDPNVVRRTAR
eukprot:gene13830-biopygen3549